MPRRIFRYIVLLRTIARRPVVDEAFRGCVLGLFAILKSC